MNPETRLVWHPLQGKLKDLRVQCLLDTVTPPHWFRVEERAQGGFPDLWWGWGASGLIELKHRSAPPARDDTPCVIDSISPQQRLFWRQAAEAGTSMHILTRVGIEWFLHEGGWARQWLGMLPIADLRAWNMLPMQDMGLGLQRQCRDLPDARAILTLCGARP